MYWKNYTTANKEKQFAFPVRFILTAKPSALVLLLVGFAVALSPRPASTLLLPACPSLSQKKARQ